MINMILKYKIKAFLSLGLIVSLPVFLQAQVKPEEQKPKATQQPTEEESKTSVTEEIEVVREYKPILADAVKIRRNPDLNSNKAFNPRVRYNLLDKRLELNSEIRTLEAQQLKPLKDEELKNNYAKAGLGNLGTTLGSLHLGTGRDQALQAGFNFDHWSMSGKLNQQKMSEQDLGIYGRSIGEQIVLDGKINYNRRTNYFYGLDPAASFKNPDPVKQRFNFIEGKGELYNRVDAYDENKLAYAAQLYGYLFNNIFEGKENTIIVSGGLSKDISKFQIGTNANLDFTTTRDRAYGSLNNHILKLNPFVKIDGEQFKIVAGINYVNEFGGDNQRMNLFPAASIDFTLIKNYLSVFGVLGGDVHKTRLKDLSYTNPFLNENINIRNQIEKFSIEGGVKGTLSANIGYKAAVHYKTIGDFSYFVNDSTRLQAFQVEYITENSNILSLTGELNVQFSKAFRLDGKLELNQYNLKNELNAWYYPGVRLSSTASFNITEKLKIDADVYLQGETKAKLYTTSSVDPNDFQVRTIKAFADLGAGASYQINKKFDAFLRVNNLLGTAYERYLFYPNYGFNILGGVSYGF